MTELKTLLHTLGLSVLGSAIFLQFLTLTSIAKDGYFYGVEENPAILNLEIALAFFALVYFVYLYQRFIRKDWR